MSDPIDDLLAQVPGGGRNGGKFLDRLTPESREVLELFQDWLTNDPLEKKSESTARAYKGYVAQALCHIQDGGDVKDLSTDVKSALNALKRFREAAATDEDVDPDDNPIEPTGDAGT